MPWKIISEVSDLSWGKVYSQGKSLSFSDIFSFSKFKNYEIFASELYRLIFFSVADLGLSNMVTSGHI